jgi:hypothetical protein
MVDKYYVPDISEFHVGFECERLTSKDSTDWQPYIVTSATWSSNAMWCMIRDEGELFRVKYLDREDIESLGWVYKSYTDDVRDAGGNWAKQTRSGYFKGDWYLSYYNDSFQHCIMIRETEELSEYPAMRFLGTIKNKSELKVLLKQLGIDGNSKRGEESKGSDNTQSMEDSTLSK